MLVQLKLDSQRITALCEDKVGGISKLMGVWGERYSELPDRATFYSWISKSSFSANLRTYLRLCACLDADPLTLISSEMFDSASLGDAMLMLVMNFTPDRRARRDGTGRGIKVSDIMGLFGPLQEWPSASIITEAYGRNWIRKFFKNDGQALSRYESIRLCATEPNWPTMIHFAYRISSSERWRMYGSVEIWRSHNRLIHLYGTNSAVAAQEQGIAVVETRFGESTCEFCLASLHEFTVEMLGDRQHSHALRFT